MQNLPLRGVLEIFLVTILFIFLLVVFVLIIILKSKQKQKNHLFKIEEMKLNHENDMLKSQLEIQEQTFQNISREIHDNIGQKLTLAKLQLNTIDFTNQSDSRASVQQIVQMIGIAIRDLSDISRSMSSEVIVNSGFIQAVEFEINQLNKTRLYNIKMIVTGDTEFLESHKELLLFRIVQEALSNIIKHAEATVVTVDIHYLTTSLTVQVKDNGKGFDQETVKNANGLLNMSKRAQMLNGYLDIKSEKGTGSTITIKIPLNESAKI